ncbi:hypothetical protein GCM10023196_036030 [Actinoallomurus vinaceus]|uniref:Uncharacterized protein n=1 Tax=Actinoallomurus vinaceus TaxID=1080074 RepID=A0ABP8UC95_9ACTN
MTAKPPTEAALHRARTALRRAACDLGVYRKGDAHTGRRPYGQAGRDALTRTREVLRHVIELEAALAAELENEAAPAATDAASDPEGIHHV